MRCVVGGCGVISAYSPNLLFFLFAFLEDRGRQSFHELSSEHLLWCLPGWDPFMLPVLTWLRHTYPDSRNLGMGRHSPGPGSCSGRGYRSPCPRADRNLWAALQPCSHPWGGAPPPARGMMALGFCRAQVWCSFLDVFHKMSVRPGLQATRYMLVKQVCKYNYLLRIFVFANPRSYYWGSWL